MDEQLFQLPVLECMQLSGKDLHVLFSVSKYSWKKRSIYSQYMKHIDPQWMDTCVQMGNLNVIKKYDMKSCKRYNLICCKNGYDDILQHWNVPFDSEYLDVAVENKKYNVVKYFLKLFEHTECHYEFRKILYLQSKLGLYECIQTNEKEIVKFLDKGPLTLSYIFFDTSCANGHLEIAKFWKKTFVNIPKHKRTKDRKYAKLASKQNNHLEILEWLNN